MGKYLTRKISRKETSHRTVDDRIVCARVCVTPSPSETCPAHVLSRGCFPGEDLIPDARKGKKSKVWNFFRLIEYGDERYSRSVSALLAVYEDVSNNSKNHHGHSIGPTLGTDNNKHGHLTGLLLSLYCSHCITPGIDWSSTVKSKSTLVADKYHNYADS